ncbi:MAG: hypothetical protein Q9194_006927 [Teloschistes cf. exilis]
MGWLAPRLVQHVSSVPESREHYTTQYQTKVWYQDEVAQNQLKRIQIVDLCEEKIHLRAFLPHLEARELSPPQTTPGLAYPRSRAWRDIMTQPHLRPPTTLQPQPKANPTSSSSSIARPTSIRTPQQSRSSSENRQSSSRAPSVEESTSEKATANLIRRVLCSQQSSDPRPIQELLPPLTSSNEIDLQLYAIIAILVRELVYSWYGKITPDQVFVEEVVRIIAHCTRALEGRLRKIDLEALVFDEIPQLIENHILSLALSPRPIVNCDSRVLQQHIGSVTSKNESDYRQLLVQGTLAVLLPTEDLENVCLRTLVADVFAETILGNSIGGKVCESWFIWTSITKLVEAVKASVSPRATGEEMEVDTRSRLEKFGLLSERGQHDTRPSRDGQRSAFSEVFWRVAQYGYLMMISVRFVIIGLVASWSEPRRSSSSSSWQATAVATDSPMVKSLQAPGHAAILRPMLDFEIFSLISTILDLSFRMPWLSGWAALLHQHLTRSAISLLRVGAVDGLLDQ